MSAYTNRQKRGDWTRDVELRRPKTTVLPARRSFGCTSKFGRKGLSGAGSGSLSRRLETVA
jgi:hypothetical protein